MDQSDQHRTFMTPNRQRAYLDSLRQQNEELFGLTGTRGGSSRDPWQNPVPNPRAPAPARIPSGDLGVRTSTVGPPKPPKASYLQSLPTPPRVGSFKRPDYDHAHGPDIPDDHVSRERPRALPKPPQMFNPLPDLGRLQLQKTPTNNRRLPQVPSKPQTGSTLPTPPTHGREPGKVTLSLTNYDIPQVRYPDDGQRETHTTENQSTSEGSQRSKRVTIPVFSFPDQEDHAQSSDTRVGDLNDRDRAAPSTAVSSDVFSFSVTPDDGDGSHGHSNYASTGLTDAQPEEKRTRRRRAPISESKRAAILKGLSCANCYEPLGQGRVITANGKRYHPSHFLCFECGIPLEHVEFYAQKSDDESDTGEDSEVYCHFDYHELFSPRCYVCTTPVIRDGIKALGKVYHAEHFFCALCSQTFLQDGGDTGDFVEKDNLAWHPKCYEEKFSPSYNCRKCKAKIKAGEQVITMGTGSHFHQACFLCAQCKGSLEDGFYWSASKEGICRACKEIEVKQSL